MGKLEEFDIFFDHPQRVYYSGEVVSGRVVVCLKEFMKMRGITMKFRGNASVDWETGGGEKTKYSSNEVYFDDAIVLAGPTANNQGNDFVLPAGRYEYPFQYMLKQDLPCSFESINGHVRYVVIVIIDRPWKFDHVCREAFTVLTTLDLNNEDISLKEPYVLSKAESVASCCCCISGHVSANITINKRCFVPGETIYVSGEIVNNSSNPIKTCTAMLIQKAVYRDGPYHLEEEIFHVNAEGRPIQAGCVDNWKNVPIVIPPLPPSRLDKCNIIDISYQFKFDVDTSWHFFNLTTDVVIGTIPLYTSCPGYQSPVNPMKAGMPFGMTGTPAISNQPTSVSNLLEQPLPDFPPPPSYEESVQGKTKIQEASDTEYIQGEQNWAPMYPLYHFPVWGGEGAPFPVLLAPPEYTVK